MKNYKRSRTTHRFQIATNGTLSQCLSLASDISIRPPGPTTRCPLLTGICSHVCACHAPNVVCRAMDVVSCIVWQQGTFSEWAGSGKGATTDMYHRSGCLSGPALVGSELALILAVFPHFHPLGLAPSAGFRWLDGPRKALAEVLNQSSWSSSSRGGILPAAWGILERN